MRLSAIAGHLRVNAPSQTMRSQPHIGSLMNPRPASTARRPMTSVLARRDMGARQHFASCPQGQSCSHASLPSDQANPTRRGQRTLRPGLRSRRRRVRHPSRGGRPGGRPGRAGRPGLHRVRAAGADVGRRRARADKCAISWSRTHVTTRARGSRPSRNVCTADSRTSSRRSPTASAHPPRRVRSPAGPSRRQGRLRQVAGADGRRHDLRMQPRSHCVCMRPPGC